MEQRHRNNQKLKLLYLWYILLQETDEDNGISMKQIIKRLDSFQVTSERKSLYDDISQLNEYFIQIGSGMEILREKQGRDSVYKLTGRTFEPAELKLLADAVLSSRFVTEKMSRDITEKLGELTSKKNAQNIRRNGYVPGKVKADNPSNLLNTDLINQAINENRVIRFEYLKWNPKKELVEAHPGKVYECSPWTLTWDNENYYLVAFEETTDKVKYFRVDKMRQVEILNHTRRRGEAEFKNQEGYTSFHMFGGDKASIHLKCSNKMAGVIIDTFGKDAIRGEYDENHFRAYIKVQYSKHFLAWVLAVAQDQDSIQIVGPQSICDRVREDLKNISAQVEHLV